MSGYRSLIIESLRKVSSISSRVNECEERETYDMKRKNCSNRNRISSVFRSVHRERECLLLGYLHRLNEERDLASERREGQIEERGVPMIR